MADFHRPDEPLVGFKVAKAFCPRLMPEKWRPEEPENFKVAAKLLEELGERLVGSPAMALAELAKNAYDADAYHVEIQFRPEGRNEIVVRDSGHGMTREEFTQFWMRLGTRHKEEKRFSEYLGRSMSGSKGVGRIAAELLSHELEILTISEQPEADVVEARLNWDEALNKQELVHVVVLIRTRSRQPSDAPGTTIRLKGLKHEWPPSEIQNLAREVWRLQPPFRRRKNLYKPPPAHEIPPLPPRLPANADDEDDERKDPKYRRPEDFSIFFTSSEKEHLKKFYEIVRLLDKIYTAEIKGQIINGVPRVWIAFEDRDPKVASFPTLEGKDAALIHAAKFRIRVYELQGKQPKNVPIDEIRDHLREYGGVQIYDNGFRLPHYGSRENDWLRITEDHARRLSRSELLPPEFQVPLGMHFMPTYYKVLGSVEVSTSIERPNLDIHITRDRLKPSPAFDALRDVVRASLHWYGMLRTEYEEKKPTERAETARGAMENMRDTLRELKDEIEPEVWDALDKSSRSALRASREREKALAREVALLGGLAAAGVATIAYHNEVERQLAQIETLVAEHPRIPSDVKQELLKWATRARGLRRVFSHLTHKENLDADVELVANTVVADVEEQLGFALKGSEVIRQIPRGQRLARASYVEWTTIFQLLFGMAIEAMRQTARRECRITVLSTESRSTLEFALPHSESLVDSTPEGFDEYTSSLTDPSKTGLAIIRAICSYRGWQYKSDNSDDGLWRNVSITWRRTEQK